MRKESKLLVAKGVGLSSQRKSLKRKIRDKKISRSIERIKAEMHEISEQQKQIREGQKEVRDKFEEIRKESAQLKEESNFISQQTAANQLRLDLMFQIVKARAENDSAKDAQLTNALRELMASQKTSKSKTLESKHHSNSFS